MWGSTEQAFDAPSSVSYITILLAWLPASSAQGSVCLSVCFCCKRLPRGATGLRHGLCS